MNMILILSVLLIVVGIVSYNLFVPSEITTKDELKKFSSCDEIKSFVKSNSELSPWYGGFREVTMGVTGAKSTAPSVDAGQGAERSEDYSATNIQVAGVDEADIVKNDGKYIYVVSGEKVVIVDAYPAKNAKILSEIKLNGTVQEIFINKDKLVVFGQLYESYYPVPLETEGKVAESKIGVMPPYYNSEMFLEVYDITDRSDPVLRRNMVLDGNYYDSRMIGNYVYVVVNQPYYHLEGEIPTPRVYSNGITKTCKCADIYYFDVPDYSYGFTTILAVNTQNDREKETTKVFLKGDTQNMYVSLENMYITYRKQFSSAKYRDMYYEKVILPVVPADIADKVNEIRNSKLSNFEKWNQIIELVQNYSENLNTKDQFSFQEELQKKMYDLQEEIAKLLEMTVVHKISLDRDNIEYKTEGEVPGTVLNQFSMDEHNGYFRIATTTREFSRTDWQSNSKNHVYVLDNNLLTVGKLENLAPGESIYSARFIGDRCYLVTFKKTDPLFVIDLKDPSNPTILGKLKIPGYSDYLHPYDENHIIGIGKEAVEAEEGNFAWYQGVKISLFDVSDVENPKEISKYNIGDRGTDSYALHDHKAFLFSKSKNLLVIPILLAEIDKEKYPGGVPANTYGDYVWQGAYVFDVSLDGGFVLKSRITHSEDESEFIKSGYYFASQYSVKRSLYIGDTLYTISDKMIKMNNMDNFEEVNKLTLPYESEYPYPIYR